MMRWVFGSISLVLLMCVSFTSHAQDIPPLQAAIIQGDRAQVTALLDEGDDPNMLLVREEVPLHIAVRHGRVGILQLLLEGGADPARVNVLGKTPLDLVVHTGLAPAFWPLYRAQSAQQPELALQVPMMLDEVVSRDHRALLEAMLNDAEALPKSSGVELPLFFKAAEWGSVSVLQYFVEEGQDAHLAVPGSAWTALHFMAFGGHSDGAEWLVTQGCDVNATDARGMTALHLAAYRGHDIITQKLLEAGATVDSVDESGRTPLHIAAYQGYGSVIRILLAHKASPELKTTEGHTPLDLVRARNFPGLRTMFSLQTATPPMTRDDFSGVPLALREAIQQQDRTALTALLASDALEVNQADRYGVTLLHYAADKGDSATIEALVKAGADVNQVDALSQWTALLYAVANGHGEAVQVLIAAGADVQAQDATGSTALHVAQFLDRRSIQPLLIDAGATEDTPNELGHTPKMVAQIGREYRASQYGKVGQP